MVKNLSNENTKSVGKANCKSIRRIKKILNKNLKLESMVQECKEDIKKRGNLVLGVYSKETNTFYEVVLTKKSLELLKVINKAPTSDADQTCSTKPLF